MCDLENRLQKVKEEMGLAEQLERKLCLAEESLRQVKTKITELEKNRQKEKKDLERLEGLSLTGLFSAILGTKAEKMDKEKQEYLAAELKYETAISTMQSVESEVAVLKEQLLPLANVKQRYHSILKEKEELLKAQGGKMAEKLFAFAEEEGHLKVLAKELEEAQEAAQKGLRALDDLIGSLLSAANWGTWDMLGGGMLSTAVKHSKIDNARSQAIKAQRYLERLSRELADVKIQAHLKIDIGGLTTFADYFIDGLIVDWVVQSRINDAKKRANDLRKRVASIERSLRAELQKTVDRVREIGEQRTALLVKSESKTF